MPQPIRTLYLEPRSDLEGRVLYFLTHSTDRRHPPHFVRPDDVPEPEKGAGFFECQRVREGPWMRLKLLRRVEDR
jgi:hypothetical protein